MAPKQKRPSPPVRDRKLDVRISADELAKWERAALTASKVDDPHLTFSQWVRATLNAEARRLEERREEGR